MTHSTKITSFQIVFITNECIKCCQFTFEWIPATSNVCERLFSRAKMIFDDYRKNFELVNLEAQLLLFVNKQLWDIKVVSVLV